ncbi:zeta toxin family protein [Mycolicibacterium parafortuitum]|uniref:Zeta toxin family protein n=2 Tax=Mycobacteriaceae TaxID=1762 RepID=A0ACC6MPB7_MYCPF|nr:zeta toxin family protein [Mycolicibacterium parafortuitum]MDZ5088722.1 zeta toxin family protein [Mycolicibacterium parafortuitum]
MLWSAERRDAHRRLLRDLWNQHAVTIPREAGAMLVAGVDGAGKTTMRSNPDNGLGADQYFVIDPDEIEEAMAQRGMIPHIDGLSPLEASPLVHEEAWEIAERLAQLAYRERCNVLWEIPMNSPDAGHRIAELSAIGYEVNGGFVDVPVDVARERAVLRHRHNEDAYRNGSGYGGRLLPMLVHESCRPSTESEPQQAAPRVSASPVDAVRALIDRHERRVLDFESLVAGVMRRWQHRDDVEQTPAEWPDVYRRCEEVPDDDDVFWVSVAEDRGSLTVGQTEKVFTALETVLSTNDDQERRSGTQRDGIHP